MQEELKNELKRFEAIYDIVINFLVEYSFQMIGAVLIFIVGLIIANHIAKKINNLCLHKGIDVTLSRFIASVSRLLLLAILLIITLDKFNVNITPLIAGIGALALGAGLAIQGLLSNYSSGINIIITRPFIVGDTISVQGVTGIVKDVLLAYTILENEDGVRITIPNKHIVGEIIHNSNEETLLELGIGIAYNSDLDLALNTINGALTKLELCKDGREPKVGIEEFADSSINIGIRLWAPTIKAHETKFIANRLIFDALATANISIPFPQREVTLLNHTEE